jgi:hypothetical protein
MLDPTWNDTVLGVALCLSLACATYVQAQKAFDLEPYPPRAEGVFATRAALSRGQYRSFFKRSSSTASWCPFLGTSRDPTCPPGTP